MQWEITHRADPIAAALADRHYSRKKPGSRQFAPPGRCLVLLSLDRQSVWVTSWPYKEFVRHAWPDAWLNSLFRREGGALASRLIQEAVSATRWHWSTVPTLGMITFIDSNKVKRKRDPGYCYLQAGFRRVGRSKNGKICLQLLPEDMPPPEPYYGANRFLFSSSQLSLPSPIVADLVCSPLESQGVVHGTGAPAPVPEFRGNI